MFSLTWPASVQMSWNKRKRLHKKRVQLPEDWFGTPTRPPFHCFGHQYGRRDVMRKRSIPIPKKCCTVNLILTDTSFFFTIDLSTPGTSLSASTRNSKTLTTFKRGAKFEVCHMENQVTDCMNTTVFICH